MQALNTPSPTGRPRFRRTVRILAAAILGAHAVLGAGESGDGGAFFGTDRLRTLHLRFTGPGWDRLHPAEPAPPRPGAPPPPERDYPWSEAEVLCDDLRMEAVSVRFKGNSSFNLSRRTGKHPFKLDFDRGHPDRTFAGLRALWLNNNANDPSQLGEALAYEMFRREGIPAPRTAFVHLVVSIEGRTDRRSLGLYTAVEDVDPDFLRRSFGSAEGLLAKPERLAGIEHLGPDWSRYEERYHVRDGSTPGTRAALIGLSQWIETASDPDFRSGLGDRVDLPGLLRFLAVNALLANHDSFLGTGHNYLLFLDARDRRARFIPWDLNEAFGRHPPAGPPAAQVRLSTLRPGGHPNRLLDRILSDPELAAAYRAELVRLRPRVLDPDRVREQAEAISRITAPARAGARDPGPTPPPGAEPPPWEWVRRRAEFVEDELAGRDPGIRVRRGRGPGPRPPRAEGPDVHPGHGPGTVGP